MEIGKKGLVAIILAFAILIGGFAYALLQVQHQIPSTAVVGELGVKVYAWVDDTTFGAEKTSHDWGMILIGEPRIATSENLVWKNTGDEAIKLKWSENLADNIGLTPYWQIEVCIDSWPGGRTYIWANLTENGGIVFKYNEFSYSYKLPNLGVGQILGFRPNLGSEKVITEYPSGSQVELKALGHLRMALASTANPTKGTYTWTMFVIGEELP